jgi:hypothetical protein
MPKLWVRSGPSSGNGAGSMLIDRKEPGYTFPKVPKKTQNIQPFEGDDIIEGRFGHSIRFGSTVLGNTSVYSEKPTWKGTTNADPIMIFRVKKPEGGSGGQPKYTIEDIKKDDASIYITTTQFLPSLKAGFDKNLDVKTAANWKSGSQIVIDAERVLLNAKKDMLILIGAKKAILTGEKVLFQSSKYKVDLDELMDFLKKWLDLHVDLVTAKAQYATASGPTGITTNMAQFLTMKTADFQKFKMP